MRLLLDTDMCIYALEGHAKVLGRLLAASPTDVGVSTITEAELRTGAQKSSSPKKTLRRVERFLAPLGRADFASADAVSYARIRARLEQKGTPIGPLDTLIAAQAVARDLVLVTNNTREFGRVHGLRLENWTR